MLETPTVDESTAHSLNHSFKQSNNRSVLDEIYASTLASGELLTLLKQYGIFPQLIREVMIDQAIAAISLTPEETLQACQQFYQKHQLKSEAQVQTWLAERGLTRDHLESLITRPIRLEHFQQTTFAHKLESYFLQRKSQLDRVVYSLIRVKDLGIAQELYFRIQAGEQSFEELARIHSQGIEAETGGLLGPVALGVPHPAIAKMLASSQPGQVLPPARLEDWIIILRLEKYLPAQLDESTRQRLLHELFEQWLNIQQRDLHDHKIPV
jgi:parvulin-like peptidyl-prolyl isomerase